jgi:hypothetical protein
MITFIIFNSEIKPCFGNSHKNFSEVFSYMVVILPTRNGKEATIFYILFFVLFFVWGNIPGIGADSQFFTAAVFDGFKAPGHRV